MQQHQQQPQQNQNQKQQKQQPKLTVNELYTIARTSIENMIQEEIRDGRRKPPPPPSVDEHQQQQQQLNGGGTAPTTKKKAPLEAFQRRYNEQENVKFAVKHKTVEQTKRSTLVEAQQRATPPPVQLTDAHRKLLRDLKKKEERKKKKKQLLQQLEEEQQQHRGEVHGGGGGDGNGNAAAKKKTAIHDFLKNRNVNMKENMKKFHVADDDDDTDDDDMDFESLSSSSDDEAIVYQRNMTMAQLLANSAALSKQRQ